MRFLRQLGGRILSTFAALLLLLSFIYGILTSHFGQEILIRSSSNEMRVLAVILSQLIQKQFSFLESYLETIQASDAVKRAIEYGSPARDELSQYLIEQRAKYPLFEDLMIYNMDGRCVGATDPDWFKIFGKSYSFFRNGLEEFNFPAIYGTDSAGKVQLVSAPITNLNHKVIGVIVAIIRLNAVYDLMAQKIGLSENRDAFLVDQDLRFITPARDGPQELVESHLASTALKEHLKDDSWVGEYLNYEGVKVLGTALKIPGYSWYVVVERRYEGVVQQIRAMQRLIFAVSLGLLAVFVIVSLLISRSVTQPLLKLVDSTRQLGAGNFSKPIDTSSTIEEVEILAIEFERMRRRVALAQDRLKERLEESEAARIENERLAAIGTLASTLAHEIRNPLNAMNLLLTRLSTKISKVQKSIGNDAAAAQGIVDEVYGEVRRLDRLVTSILDYARPVHLDRRKLNILETLESCLEFYRALFASKKIECSLRYEGERSRFCVLGDQDKLKQCFINALQNAVEAMPEGGNLRVTATEQSDQDVLRVDIVDSGVGVSSDAQRKLFSPFFTTKSSGSGLGLSTVQKIISAHGGRVEILAAAAVNEPLPWSTILRVNLPMLKANHNQLF